VRDVHLQRFVDPPPLDYWINNPPYSAQTTWINNPLSDPVLAPLYVFIFSKCEFGQETGATEHRHKNTVNSASPRPEPNGRCPGLGFSQKSWPILKFYFAYPSHPGGLINPLWINAPSPLDFLCNPPIGLIFRNGQKRLRFCVGRAKTDIRQKTICLTVPLDFLRDS